MPSKSKAQQALMGMALAVRKGELARSKVDKTVLDIVDSDMSTTDLEHFASTKRKSLPDHLKESLDSSNLGSVCFYFQYISPEDGKTNLEEINAPYLNAAKDIFQKGHPNCKLLSIKL